MLTLPRCSGTMDGPTHTRGSTEGGKIIEPIMERIVLTNFGHLKIVASKVYKKMYLHTNL